MMTTEHPLVMNYLATVAREAAGLSPERRNELLADLEEHIAVALAEESTSGDDGIRAVLTRLGDPRTIAATALGDEPPAPPAPQVSWVRPVALLVLLVVAGPMTVLNAFPVLGCIPVIGAIWLLWASSEWLKRDKVLGTVAALAPLAFGVAQWLIPAGGISLGLGALFIPLGLALLAFPIAVGVYLLWAAVRRS
ncbi:hypothetical protein [Streptomyces sp. NPDC007205]|uniref:HAAS signaling domain-containing protein n=1 Tax=Streptomyces sp. NPDC007205 TaxID=3154316 RepID=UPI00340B9D37